MIVILDFRHGCHLRFQINTENVWGDYGYLITIHILFGLNQFCNFWQKTVYAISHRVVLLVKIYDVVVVISDFWSTQKKPVTLKRTTQGIIQQCLQSKCQLASKKNKLLTMVKWFQIKKNLKQLFLLDTMLTFALGNILGAYYCSPGLFLF